MQIQTVVKDCTLGGNSIQIPQTNPEDAPLVIIAAELSTYEPGVVQKPQTDFGQLYVMVPGGEVATSLQRGFTHNGALLWQGRVPLHSPHVLRGDFYSCRAGNVMRLTYATVTKDEAAYLGGSVANQAASTWPNGLLRIIKVQGAATVATVVVRPDAGYKWRVLDGWFFHDDDSGAHTLYWEFYDGTNTMARNGGSFSTSILCFLHNAETPEPLVINRDVYLRMQDATGLAAGHTLTAYLLVLESGDYGS
jgi:hypothetical protein